MVTTKYLRSNLILPNWEQMHKHLHFTALLKSFPYAVSIFQSVKYSKKAYKLLLFWPPAGNRDFKLLLYEHFR